MYIKFSLGNLNPGSLPPPFPHTHPISTFILVEWPSYQECDILINYLPIWFYYLWYLPLKLQFLTVECRVANNNWALVFVSNYHGPGDGCAFAFHMHTLFIALLSWSYLFCLPCRNIIHGSDGPETAKDEINLWFKPEELVTYTSNSEKWVYGNN